MTLTERAMGEWLDREVSGLAGEALFAKLGELAPQISMSQQRAAEIYRRYRYELRFSAHHCEVNRKFGVQESTYDPAVLAEVFDEEAVQDRTGCQEQEGEEDAEDPSKAQVLTEATATLLDYLKPGMLKRKVRWKFWKWRGLYKGETAEQRLGSGELNVNGVLVSWLLRAVVIVRNGKPVEVMPEVKLRRFRAPTTTPLLRKGSFPSKTERKNKYKRRKSPDQRIVTAIQLEKLEFVGEELNSEELCRRFAAMLRLYKGSVSGLRSQKHLADAAGVTKQAVNDMELRMKQYYERRTGGRAQFEGVNGAGPAKRKKSGNPNTT